MMGNASYKPDRLAGGLLVATGIVTLGVAFYLMVIRPPMLPEDLRFTGLDPHALSSPMADWLRIVFRTWGGFVAGFAILIISLGAYLWTSNVRALRWGVAFGVLVAFGRFLASNIALRSDFLPAIVIIAALAVIAALLLVLRR